MKKTSQAVTFIKSCTATRLIFFCMVGTCTVFIGMFILLNIKLISAEHQEAVEYARRVSLMNEVRNLKLNIEGFRSELAKNSSKFGVVLASPVNKRSVVNFVPPSRLKGFPIKD